MSDYSTYNEPQYRFFAGPRVTWAVQRIILLNIAVFALQLLIDPVLPFIFQGAAWDMGAPGGILNYWFGFQPDLMVRGLIWKPFTYQFLHFGLMHLFMNMLWLFFFGPDVERTLGTQHFYRFYLVCGVVSVLFTFVPYAYFGQAISVTGASGAVMGVMVAFATIDPDRQFYLFPLPMPINARALVIIVFVYQILMAAGQSNVSVATHLGGMFTGFAYMKALPLLNRWRLARRRDRAMNKPETKMDRVGEAVDNIFKFDDKKRR